MTERRPFAGSRALRSYASAAVLTRLRAEYPLEQAELLAEYRGSGNPNASQKAATELRRRHPGRAAELYAEEVVKRGLPAPKRVNPS